MLKSVSEITGYRLQAQDGEIGRCKEFLFDDERWVVRYMVAKTSKWLPGRKVLISPVFVEVPAAEPGQLPVRLTKKQIEDSPELDQDAPVSRQHELAIHEYYALPVYWFGPDLWGAYPNPASVQYPISEPQSQHESDGMEAGDRHLRSTSEVHGYHIAATDGEVGHVEDFLFDDLTWALRYLVVDTRNWLPGRKVLLSPAWLDAIQWVDRKVYVELPVEAIKNAPEYDSDQPLSRDYEIDLFDHYGREYYWK